MPGIHLRARRLVPMRDGVLAALGAAALLAAYTTAPTGGVLQGVVYLVVAVGVAAVLAVVTAPSRGRWRGPAWPWRLICAAVLLWAAGHGYYLSRTWTGGEAPGIPSVEDVAYLLGYCAMIAGVLGVARRLAGPLDRDGLLDAAMVAVAVAVVVWAIAVPAGASEPVASRVLTMAYTLADVLLIGVMARLLLLSARSSVALRLLVAALFCVLLGDIGYLWGAIEGIEVVPVMAGVHLVAHLLLAAAVLHPSFGEMATQGPPSAVAFSGRRRALLAAIWLVPAALLAVVSASGLTLQLPVVLTGWLVLFALASVRLSRVVEQAANERTRRLGEVRFRAAFDHALVGMALVSAGGADKGCVLEINHRLADMLGRPGADVVGRPVSTLVLGGDRQVALSVALRVSTREGQVVLPGEHRLATAHGREVWAVLGVAAALGADPALSLSAQQDERVPDLAVVQVEDVTGRRDAEDRLKYQATHDRLTGLPNRVLLADRLDHALSRRGRAGVIAALVLDLDRFKVVNDSLGHTAGDELLRLVAQRLAGVVRPSDTVARLGGDEFVLLLEDLVDEQEVVAVADRISQAMAEPLDLAAGRVSVTTSTGIAIAGTGESAESLLRSADMAMYMAKRTGGARHQQYDERLYEVAMQRMGTEQWLRGALLEQGLRLALQPVVDLRTGALYGHEALVRCRHPQHGLLAPSAFLRVAEDSGLIVPIGAWVLRTALAHVAADRASPETAQPRRMAVNVSARQLLSPGFDHDVITGLAEAGLAGDRLCLEVTEHALTDTLEVAARKLHRLRDIGVEIALDDFGTGYSSLAHLRHLPVDVVKIDRSFVSGMLEEPADASIVEGLINLAHALGLRTVGEGVETPEQALALAGYGCDFGQGFLLGRPWVLDAETAEADPDPAAVVL